jgi:acetyl esterase/lipase
MHDRPLRAARALAIVVVVAAATACPVANPDVSQLIPWNLALDQRPDFRDVSYGPGAVRKLDVYLPDGAHSGIGLIYLHSGGWCCGDKSSADGQGIPQYLMKQGHVLFSANYTLTGPQGQSPFPANIDDVKWAIAWANQPAVKAAYGYSKVVVMGGSAGGHLAALATTTDHARPGDMPAGMSVRPDAGMSFSGPIDMTTWGAQGTEAERAWQLLFFQGFWGSGYTSPDQIPLLARLAASPNAFVDPNDPPIYLASGSADAITLPAYNANVLEQRYADVGPGTLKAWNDVVDGDGHNLVFVNIAAVQLFLGLLLNGSI